LNGDSLVALKKVKIRKSEEGLPKELVREVESNECFDEDSKYVVKIKEVFLGKI